MDYEKLRGLRRTCFEGDFMKVSRQTCTRIFRMAGEMDSKIDMLVVFEHGLGPRDLGFKTDGLFSKPKQNLDKQRRGSW